MAKLTTPHQAKARGKLISFFLSIVALTALMIYMGDWAPRLGLDLRGGTTVTLTARQDQANAITPESMEMARSIIAQRVDGLGVGESSVTVQGDRQIEVAVPNVSGDELVAIVGRTAQLNFRPLYYYTEAEVPEPTEPGDSASPDPSESPSADAPPGEEPVTEPSVEPTTEPVEEEPGLPTAPPTTRPTEPASDTPLGISEVLAWAPTAQDIEEFIAYQCGDPFPDVLDQPLITCDEAHTIKFLLAPVAMVGERVQDAQAGIPTNQLTWQVSLTFDNQGSTQFAELTRAMYQLSDPRNILAIVLDSEVVSFPVINEPIPSGTASISGSGINEKTAMELANVLRYGSLPLTFDVSSVDTISPTLGGEQLRAGLIAGLIGLILVLGYSFIYYRALGLLVFASLVAAGVLTWILLTLLGSSVGFAMNLPGVAGVVIGIGMTADSFIVYFERIRDEIREGHSLVRAIESGWTKARGTILVADGVQLLSAVVLFFLAIGAVRGFAFTLLVTTAIDIYIVFFLTKPLMTMLGRTKFFGEGHKYSGLSAETLEVSQDSLMGRVRRTPSVVGGAA